MTIDLSSAKDLTALHSSWQRLEKRKLSWISINLEKEKWIDRCKETIFHVKKHLFRWFRKISLQQSGIFSWSSFIFKFQPKCTQKYPNLAFLVQNFKFLFLQLDKLEDADFKYGNCVFKIQFKITQIKSFWSYIQEFLFSHVTLLLENLSLLISNMKNFFFQIPAKKYVSILIFGWDFEY